MCIRDRPCTATDAPVVGVAITAETMVPGCATGGTHAADVEEAARFMLEVAKAFGRDVYKRQFLYRTSLQEHSPLPPFSL